MKTPTRFRPLHSPQPMTTDPDGPFVKLTDYTALQEENAKLREALKTCPALGCESQILNEWWDSVAMPALAQTQDTAKAGGVK